MTQGRAGESNAASQELVQGGFLKAVTLHPNSIALVSDGHTSTYAEVCVRAYAFAARVGPLLKSNKAPRVALCLPNSTAVIDVFLGTLMAGGCVCLFDPAWPRSLFLELLEDHHPDVLVASEELLADIREELRSTVGISKRDLVGASETASIQQQSTMAKSDSPFLIGFTSGSSGKPKAFIRSHRTWIESFKHSAMEFGDVTGARVLAPGPLSHGLSLYAVIEALCAGATAVIQSKFKALDVLEVLGTYPVSSLVVVPAMLDALLEAGSADSYVGLQRIITAGAKLSPSLRVRARTAFPTAEIIEYYGASELSFITIAKGSEVIPPESVGRAFSGVEISVRDDGVECVETGQIGTVWIKSDMVCSGYVGFTDGSGLKQEKEWATVGDIGHLDDEGFLFLAGREGSAITSAGYTVYPSAIENALLNHPGVIDTAVLGLPHDRWGEVIAAVIVPASGTSVSEEELRTYCEGVLEPYACPRRWRLTASLERTQSGKVKRAVLAALFD